MPQFSPLREEATFAAPTSPAAGSGQSVERLDDFDIRERQHALLVALRACAGGDLQRRLPTMDGPLGLLVSQFNCVLDARADSDRELRLRNEALEAARRRVEVQADELRRKSQQLDEARLSAESANLAKTAFLANMSHEIRTPMTAILGYADLLLENEDEADAAGDRRDWLLSIKRNAKHLLNLLNDALDVAKIEADRMTVERIACSPGRIVDDVISLMSARAIEKGLTLRACYVSPVPTSIVSDPTRIRQILFNLVSNSVKFTERGEVRIDVSAACVDGDQVRMTFCVVDSGIGIDAQQLKKLFHPFSQADVSTSRKYGGTGLGLSITRGLAQRLGGDVDVASTPGEGSQFTVHVMVEAAADTPWTDSHDELNAEPRSEAPKQPSSELPSLAPHHILLAEDGVDNQRLIGFLLRRAGARVSLAKDGLEAVRMTLASLGDASNTQTEAEHEDSPVGDVDLVLMDMQMPGIDGLEATQQLRQADFGRPIIALTANAMQGVREKCLEAGCDDYLTKPIDAGRLIEACAHWIERGKCSLEGRADGDACDGVAPI